ncbi:MAG: ABC transporter permease [Flavobacteriales bacterium]|nr:ABC transporter permease [Flavobacteriales bacterium]MCB9167867.1 ABC transporter permease [Flavobacteriales bacterium]
MVPLIAWRNVWRNRLRSLLVALSIAVGLWGGTFFMAVSWGMYAHQLDTVINDQVSHIQVHAPRFRDDDDGRYGIPEADVLLDSIRTDSRVKAATERIVLPGVMVQSTANSAGVSVLGIDPKDEEKVTGLHDRLTDGTYFTGTKSAPMVMGAKLAQKLKIDLRGRTVISFLNAQDSLVAMSFRVVGLYHSGNSALEEGTVYVRREDLARQMHLGTPANEIAVLLTDEKDLDAVQRKMQAMRPDMRVESWKELSPELRLVVDSFSQYTYIFIGIILLALMFGIVNTMLMAVLERTRELGMLMAIGMERRRVFAMVMWETVYMAVIGAPLGMLLAWVSIQVVGRTGIDLTAFAAGLSSYGFDAVIHPALAANFYLEIAGLGIAAAILSAIYPAWKAVRMRPTEALRKI